MNAPSIIDIDRQIQATHERHRADAEARRRRHEAENAAADEGYRRMISALATARGILEADAPSWINDGAWISTSDLAQLWRVSKDTAYRRVTRSPLVAQPIPSRTTIARETQWLRSHIAPIIAHYGPKSDLQKSECGPRRSEAKQGSLSPEQFAR